MAGMAQNITVTGTVTDDQDMIIGATVKAVPGTAGTVTDIDGRYSITVPSTAKQLVVTYVGYKPKTVNISGRTKIDIKLESASQMLNEVVSIGYAKVRRQERTSHRFPSPQQRRRCRARRQASTSSPRVARLEQALRSRYVAACRSPRALRLFT